MSEEIFSYIDDHAEQFVEDLKKLCRQPSVSAQNLGVRECADLVGDMMKGAGLESRLIPAEDGPPIVFGELKAKGKRKTLGFYDHYDVQPPEPLELWQTPPFSAEERDGKIYARGVSDNKGNLVSRLKAIEAIKKTLGKIPVNLKLFAEGEEEIGSPHLLQFVRNNKELLTADAYIWESGFKDATGRPVISLGVKGILYVELRAKGAKSDLHSGKWAKLVVNPAWRLVWALSTLKDRKEKVLIPGFYDGVKKPTKEELAILNATPFEEARIKRELEIPQLLGGKRGFAAMKAHIFEPSCNICGLDSGYKGTGSKTVLPSKAMAKIDIRLVEGQDPDDIFRKLKRHLRNIGLQDIELGKMGGSYPASKTLPTEKIAQVAMKTAREIYGKEPILTWATGSSPVYTIKKTLNIPVVSTGVDYLYNYNHAPNENLRVKEDYIQGIKHMAALILDFGKE